MTTLGPLGPQLQSLACVLCAVPGAGGVINCADQRQPAHLLVCPHVVIVQINAHSKLAVYFLLAIPHHYVVNGKRNKYFERT